MQAPRQTLTRTQTHQNLQGSGALPTCLAGRRYPRACISAMHRDSCRGRSSLVKLAPNSIALRTSSSLRSRLVMWDFQHSVSSSQQAEGKKTSEVVRALVLQLDICSRAVRLAPHKGKMASTLHNHSESHSTQRHLSSTLLRSVCTTSGPFSSTKLRCKAASDFTITRKPDARPHIALSS